MTTRPDILTFIRYHSSLMSAILVLVVSVVLLTFGVVPMWNRLFDARSQQETAQQELDQLSQKVVILASLDDSILQERVTVLDRVLPPTKDVVAYLTAVDGLSRDFGLSLGGVSLSPGDISTSSADVAQRKQSGLSALETEVRILGDSDAIYGFLRQIESTAPLMLVKDVEMNPLGTGQSFLLTVRLAMLYADPLASGSLKGVVSLFSASEDRLFETLRGFRRYTLAPSAGELPSGTSDLFSPSGVTAPDQSSLPEEEGVPEESPAAPASPAPAETP